MIKDVCIKGRIGPQVFCDTCGKRIEKAGLAAVITVKNIGDGESSEILHVHKGKCHDLAEKKLGGNVLWGEMSRHFLHLIYNVGLSTEHLEAQKEADREAGDLFNTPE
ncbi:MAG: hypothetical protein HZA31_04335 [Opitutae bacterium]|nr:hypothetical protein [Opitutae bacterium]